MPVIFLFIVVFCLVNKVWGVLYITKKEFTKNNLPADAQLSKVNITVKNEDRDSLIKTWNLRMIPDEQRFYVAKTSDGTLVGATTFQIIYSQLNNEYHHVATALNGDGSVKEVGFIDLENDWPQRIAKKPFFDQFKDKPPKTLKLYEDIDSITGATESVETVILAVNTAMALYKKYILKQ